MRVRPSVASVCHRTNSQKSRCAWHQQRAVTSTDLTRIQRPQLRLLLIEPCDSGVPWEALVPLNPVYIRRETALDPGDEAQRIRSCARCTRRPTLVAILAPFRFHGSIRPPEMGLAPPASTESRVVAACRLETLLPRV